MSLETYLRNHFVDTTIFTLMVGITVDRLDQLIVAKAILSATYTCDGLSVSSAVFGATPINESITGEFFRPECVWCFAISLKRPNPAALADGFSRGGDHLQQLIYQEQK